jgi:hypothetical protein
MTDVVIVSLTEFYSEYPEFNVEEYKTICPVAFRQAKTFISIKNSCRLADERRKMAIYLLTAHLSVLMYKNQTGQAGQGGLVASAGVGEVNISYVQIPSMDMWSYWLAQTPYGLELLALFETLTAVPFYVGGSLERVF